MLTSIPHLGDKYNALFEKLANRKEQIMKFKSFLEIETCWLTSPASTRFHLNIEHGLLLHSVSVTYNALKIKNWLAPDISDESIVIAALFHDLGKIGLPGKPYYLPNDNKWEIEKRGITYKINPDIITMNIAIRIIPIIGQVRVWVDVDCETKSLLKVETMVIIKIIGTQFRISTMPPVVIH